MNEAVWNQIEANLAVLDPCTTVARTTDRNSEEICFKLKGIWDEARAESVAAATMGEVHSWETWGEEADHADVSRRPQSKLAKTHGPMDA